MTGRNINRRAAASAQQVAMAAGKRKRDAGFSERERFEHKSRTLLQREAKKVKAFLARKAVQQLKQLKEKQQRAQVQKRERELAALKALDVKQVVARAFEATGLGRGRTAGEEDGERDGVDSDDDAPAMAMADESEDSDSGFDSEEYENARGLGGSAQRATEVASVGASEDDGDQEDRSGDTGASSSERDKEKPPKAADNSAEALDAALVTRILAHKQMVPLLAAIRQWVEKEKREEEKRTRRQEKRALKRGRKETLVGGRSAAPPSSMFLGSLSGRGGVDDMDGDDVGGTRAGHMAGADDDIAEFLGETKKKKNRPGQMARRQKALRMEEARKRKEDRERGIFRRHERETGIDGRGSGTGKYGRSERPKKPKKQQQQQQQQQQTRDAAKIKDKSKDKPSSQRAVVAKDRKPEVAHPSWVAKQAQKEKERVSITAFSGKKITFD